MLELYTLEIEIIEKPAPRTQDAIKNNVANAAAVMTDALKRAHEEVANAKMELGRLFKDQKEIQGTHNKDADELRKKCVGVIDVWKATTLWSGKTLRCEQDEVISQSMSKTTEHGSAKTRYCEAFASLRRISKAGKD